MALDFDAVALQLAAAVDAADLTLNDQRITALDHLPDSLSPPVFCVCEFQQEYHKSFGARVEVNVTCRLFVSRGSDDEGQRTTRQAVSAIGSASIPAVIEATRGVSGSAGSGRSLSGAADDLIVRGSSGPRLYQFGEVNFYGVEYTVFVTG